METKGVTCKIPLDLHNRITEEIKQNESTMSKFIEQIILEHYAKGAITMGKTRTMAFHVSEELFQQIKDYLARFAQVYHRKLSQKEFIISLIEQALAEADEEFEAAEATEAEDTTEAVETDDTVDEIEDDSQENEVTDDVEMDEDAQPADAPEDDAWADAAMEGDADEDAGDDDPAFGADAERAV